MTSKRPHWDLYKNQMSELDLGHALWEPDPVSDSKRIQPGDVGYIRTGCFHLLFPAGLPLGERRLGSDVPRTFERLGTGKIVQRTPLPAGALCTNGVRATRVPLKCSRSPPLTSTPTSSPPPPPPMMGSASSTCFRLTGGQGAALLTKYSTYREDVQRAGTFERYAKEHYDSWVEFARETGHGDVNPILVTGIDRTRDFAMLCYSNGDDDLGCEFITSVPGATGWGTWHKTGLVYTNHGPQLLSPPSSTQASHPTSSGDDNAEPFSDEYNQCVFIRYYTVRRRLGIPRVIKAAAGPHDPGRGGRGGGEPPFEARYDSDQGSDSAPSSATASLFGDDTGDDGYSITSTDTESGILMHNDTADGRDDFDVIADYIFQNSSAESVLLHHQDIALLRGAKHVTTANAGCSIFYELGGGADLPAQLLERRPQITVDENGVGMIGAQTGFSVGTSDNGIPAPTAFTFPDDNEHEVIGAMIPLKSFGNGGVGAGGDLAGSRTVRVQRSRKAEKAVDRDIPAPIISSSPDDNDEVMDTMSPLEISSNRGMGDSGESVVPPLRAVWVQRSGGANFVEYGLPVPTGFVLDGNRREPLATRIEVQRSRKAETAADLEVVMPSRKRSRRSDPAGQSHATLPAISIVVRGSRQFKMMIQTTYRSALRQGSWIRQPPIEFGWVNLVDAENPSHPGRDDEVLNSQVIGGSIICRLNFSGRELGKRRITTTNHRNIPGPITKGKLASEVAKLVKRSIEAIKAQDGCGGATFENAVLTKLFHVSTGSWQPELWYEVTPPGRDSP